jgi:hypothetical protein
MAAATSPPSGVKRHRDGEVDDKEALPLAKRQRADAETTTTTTTTTKLAPAAPATEAARQPLQNLVQTVLAGNKAKRLVVKRPDGAKTRTPTRVFMFLKLKNGEMDEYGLHYTRAEACVDGIMSILFDMRESDDDWPCPFGLKLKKGQLADPVFNILRRLQDDLKDLMNEQAVDHGYESESDMCWIRFIEAEADDAMDRCRRDLSGLPLTTKNTDALDLWFTKLAELHSKSLDSMYYISPGLLA